MNFRSKYGRELKLKLRRGEIEDKLHDDCCSELANVSHALKEAKALMDKLQIQVKRQV